MPSRRKSRRNEPCPDEQLNWVPWEMQESLLCSEDPADTIATAWDPMLLRLNSELLDIEERLEKARDDPSLDLWELCSRRPPANQAPDSGPERAPERTPENSHAPSWDPISRAKRSLELHQQQVLARSPVQDPDAAPCLQQPPLRSCLQQPPSNGFTHQPWVMRMSQTQRPQMSPHMRLPLQLKSEQGLKRKFSADVVANRPQGYKTTLCHLFEMGGCKNGDACNDAHGEDELRPADGEETLDVGTSPDPVFGSSMLASGPLPAGVLPSLPGGGFGLPGLSDVPSGPGAISSAAGVPTVMAGLSGVAEPSAQCVCAESKASSLGVPVDVLRQMQQQLQEAQQQHPQRPNLPSQLPGQPGSALLGYKLSICRSFQQTGRCGLGAWCTFAHGDQELAAAGAAVASLGAASGFFAQMVSGTASAELHEYYNQMVMGSFGGAASCGAAPGTGGQEPVRSSFKTQLCKFFPEGKCRKGQLCTYAHGDQDMRSYTSRLRRGGEPRVVPPESSSMVAAATAAASAPILCIGPGLPNGSVVPSGLGCAV